MARFKVNFVKYGKIILRILALVFALFPVYAGLIIALTPKGHVFEMQLYPRYWHFSNFVQIWHDLMLSTWLLNSIIYASSAALINLLVSVPAAYAFSRFRFRGRELGLFALLVTQMMASVVIIPSLYILMKALGLRNSYFGVILILAAITSALSVWLLIGFFDSIPRELEESAYIDGASSLQALVKIVLPLAAPGIVTVAIFAFLNSYNNFLIPLVFLTKDNLYPLTVGVSNLLRESVPRYYYAMVGAIVTIGPPVLIFAFLRRYVVKGLTAGAVKT